MDQFYMIVVLIAVVILVLCLTGIGILMRYQNAGQQYPPTANTCPDGWTAVGGSSCISPGLAAGITYGTSGTDGYSETTTGTGANAVRKATINFPSSYDICKKKKWARKYNISWDGVSNYTKC